MEEASSGNSKKSTRASGFARPSEITDPSQGPSSSPPKAAKKKTSKKIKKKTNFKWTDEKHALVDSFEGHPAFSALKTVVAPMQERRIVRAVVVTPDVLRKGVTVPVKCRPDPDVESDGSYRAELVLIVLTSSSAHRIVLRTWTFDKISSAFMKRTGQKRRVTFFEDATEEAIHSKPANGGADRHGLVDWVWTATEMSAKVTQGGSGTSAERGTQLEEDRAAFLELFAD